MAASSIAAAILLMMLVTYGTRIAPLLLVSRVPLTDRFERIAHAASGSVLAAMIAQALVRGDGALAAGVLVAALICLWKGRPMLALAAGLAITLSIRA